LGFLASAVVANPCPPQPGHDLCRHVFSLTSNEHLARTADDLQGPIAILLIVVAAFVITRVVRIVIRRVVKRLVAADSAEPTARRSQRARTIGSVLRSVTAIVVWSFALIWILSMLGVNLAPLIAGAGVVGIALGFGAQSVVRDFLSGLFMLMEDQYGVGDVIDVGEASGTVEGVSLRVTRIRDQEGILWHVPNGEIRRVGNKTQQWARAVIDIGVSYDADVEIATAAIGEAATSMWQDDRWRALMLDEPEVLGVETLGLDRVTIRATVKTLPQERWRVAREFRARIMTPRTAAGIELPGIRPPTAPPPSGSISGSH
jgi:small-conductance mechanosensitive channel